MLACCLLAGLDRGVSHFLCSTRYKGACTGAAGGESHMMVFDKGPSIPLRLAVSEALVEENDNCLFSHFNSIMKH